MPLADLSAPQANADRITLEDAGEGCTRIFAQGIGGHASLPEGTINAIALVVGYLHEVMDARPDLFDPAERSYLDLLSVVHDGTAGVGLGIAAESDAFGALTCNAGTIEVADGHILQTIDVRYPDSTTSDEMTMIWGRGLASPPRAMPSAPSPATRVRSRWRTDISFRPSTSVTPTPPPPMR